LFGTNDRHNKTCCAQNSGRYLQGQRGDLEANSFWVIPLLFVVGLNIV